MRVVFAGTPMTAVPSLDALLASAHDVVAVLTRPDAPAGRGRHVTPSPVKQHALDLGINVLTPRRPSEPEFLDQLRAIAPDCCPVVAYGALIPEVALTMPEHGWVNLHFSLLPAWRGAAPVQHALLAGDEITGATTFRIEQDLDTGPVFGVVTTEVGARETSGELLERLAQIGSGLLVSTLDGIEAGSVSPVPQPAEGVSLAPKLKPGDARVDWTAPALRVDRLVRACTPEPGAWTTYRDKRLGLGPVRPVSRDISGATGPLAAGELHVDRTAVFVGTGNGVVELGEVRPEGKAAMRCDAWARGVRPAAGERLS